AANPFAVVFGWPSRRLLLPELHNVLPVAPVPAAPQSFRPLLYCWLSLRIRAVPPASSARRAAAARPAHWLWWVCRYTAAHSPAGQSRYPPGGGSYKLVLLPYGATSLPAPANPTPSSPERPSRCQLVRCHHRQGIESRLAKPSSAALQ